MNPFQILDVEYEADDALIKQAYIRKVQEYPPDLHPEQFKSIRSAFEAISDKKKRAKYRLFSTDKVEMTEIAQYLLQHRDFSRPVMKDFNDMFVASLKNLELPGGDFDGS